MLIQGTQYYIKSTDDEVFYKSSSRMAVFENSRLPLLYRVYNEYNTIKPYITDSLYILEGNIYKCKDIDIYHIFVYDEEDLYKNTNGIYIKNIENIVKIGTYNEKSNLDLKKFIKLNQKIINKLISKKYSTSSELIQYQSDIQTHLFTNKYTILDGIVTINSYMYLEIPRFNYQCSLLPKSNKDFYVFRKQRLTSTYNPYYQFNEGISETYLLPFSTTTSYEFAKSWSSPGLILMIHVPKNANYMVLHDQSQHEITLSSGTLEYVEKGYYKNQPIIICNYTSN